MDDKNLAKEQTYGMLALAHARAHQMGGVNQPHLPTIEQGSLEWQVWQRYFMEHLGFEPVAMRRIRWGLSQKMTVPSIHPDDFDGSYRVAGNER